ncbi:MAG: hypothetical protein IT493_11960 [Gammaproteobacteria bacterium]|nr:hypothetical protein [Gammaproteobacteria bacterium]
MRKNWRDKDRQRRPRELLCSLDFGGGGGGNQTANTVSKFEPPAWLVQPWKQYVEGVANVAAQPYVPFDGMRVAPMNPYQLQGMNFLEDRALYGAPDLNAARGMAMNMTQGNYANPAAGNIGGIAAGNAYNPWAEGVYGAVGQRNPYASDAYTQQILNDTTEQMAKAWSTGGAAQIDAMANEGGGWGGGGWKAMQQAGLANLEKQVGQMSSQLLQDQQRFKAGNWQQDIGRDLQAMGMGSGMYQGDVGNQLAANQQLGGLWQNDIGNMLAAGGLAGNLSQDDWQAGKSLAGIGDAYQQYMQQLLGDQYSQWQAANQYPLQQLDWIGNAIGAASGGFRNQMTTANQQAPSFSPLTALLGIGALGMGLR